MELATTPTTARSGRVARNLSLRFAIVAGVTLAYFAAGKLGLSLAFVNASASPVWPPTGIAIAAGLIFGADAFLGVFVGAFVVNVTTAGGIGTSLAIASGNTLEAFAATWLVTRFAAGRAAFDRPQSALLFILLAGVVATTVSATFGVATLVVSGLAPASAAPTVWLTWWLGDAAGAIVVAPVIMLWARPGTTRLTPARVSEALVLVALTAFLGIVVFTDALVQFTSGRSLAFVCIPPVVWAAYRFSQREAATLALFLSGIAVVGTLRGTGTFVRATANESLLIVQAFIGIVVLLALPFASVVEERRRTALALASAHGDLEVRVAERTNELVEAQGRFAGFTRHLPGLAWIKESDGRYVFANESFAATLDKTPAELLGKRDEDLFSPEIAREYRENDATVLRTGHVVSTTERQLVRGEMRHSLVNKFLIPSSKGTFVGGVAIDMTQQMRAEEESRRQLVTRKLVRRLLRELAAAQSTTHDRRSLGRSIANETETTDLAAALQAFQGMGIGTLSVARAEGGRFTFHGSDLLECTPGFGSPTCYIALGYLESAVGHAIGASVLGTETACQSQGHPHCVFAVHTR